MFAVEMQHITKRFGNFKANDVIDFVVKKGEIHALVGENGAGKSTLMKILYGMCQPDAGEILVNGTKEIVSTPTKAISLGIGMVHQHFMLISPLTVTENIILGTEPTFIFSTLNLTEAEKTVQQLSEKYKLKVDPKIKVETISVGMQQRVEILKILYRNAEILILDEPTPVLAPQEVEDLFITLRNLKAEGKTVILITHKLAEVMEISDSVTVLRRGKVVAQLDTKSTSQLELARLMVGKDIVPSATKSLRPNSEPVLRVENINVHDARRLPTLLNILFSISGGEILGIAAIEGNGQSELIEVLTGLRKKTEGKILIRGVELSERTDFAKIAHIPEDRLKRGLILDFSLAENLILGRQQEAHFCKSSFLSKTTINHHADTLIQQFDIRPPIKELFARGFSGGNQQKAIIARELSKNAQVIIASQPTRGLDIGASKFVHEALLAERNKGNAILLVSSDLEELLQLSDRIAVMYEGKIVATVYSNETSEKELGQYMTGIRKQIV